ncbi:MAG: hypothetical protein AB7I33_13820 [Gemmatimonadales bacterium]
MRLPHRLTPLLLLTALAACSNAGDGIGFGATGAGAVSAFVYLDRNGSLDITQNVDTTFAGVRVGLVVLGTADTALTGTTDAQGLVSFTAVPFGDYRLVVDTATVGDSLEVQAVDSGTVRLRANTQNWAVSVRLGFPLVTVAQARTLAAGARVFVRALVLSGPGAFADTTGYITAGGTAIRLTRAANAQGFTQPGDSVRVLGTVASRAGQPVLDLARLYVFVASQGPPAGIPLTTALAALADTGRADAALAAITAGAITDTMTVTGGFRITVDDGSGPLDILVDPILPFAKNQAQPGKSVTGRGVLVPTGSGTWVLKPRAVADLTIF